MTHNTFPEHKTCLEKQEKALALLFPKDFVKDTFYKQLMQIGRSAKPFPKEFLTKEHLVLGCQSDLYLHSEFRDNALFFFTYTEALISSGIAVLFSTIYSGETPETILTCKPLFFEKLSKHLSMGRSRGGESLFLSMQRIAVQHLAQKSE